MNVATKNELLQAVECLKEHNLINAAYVLDDALSRFQFHWKCRQHVLVVRSVPALLEDAIAESCTEQCEKFSDGTCPFKHEDKYKCYRISIAIK